MKTISFTADAWIDYLYWAEHDQKVLKRINKLIEEIKRSPFKGSGKPEPLKFNLKGYWSRRIALKDRLIYRFESGKILIISCRGHYKT
jgi:toxin YoeB